MKVAGFIGKVLTLSIFFCAAPLSSSLETYRQLNNFSKAFQIIQKDSYPARTDAQLLEAALEGMIQAVDASSGYLKAETSDDLKRSLCGTVQGIGAEIESVNEKICVVSCLDGGPASKAGLRAGDEISAIAGKKVNGKDVLSALAQLREQGEEPLVLTIARRHPSQKKELLTIKVFPAFLTIPPMHGHLLGQIGYVRIPTFHQKNTARVFKSLILGFKKKTIKGLILDLRNNPGGQIDQAVQILSMILDKGPLAWIRNRQGEMPVERASVPVLLSPKLPMVVLVSKGSASASEVIAGALQDSGRAVIMGSHTYGKGTLQKIEYLPCEGRALRVTVGEYLTPRKRVLQTWGIKPDVCLDPQEIGGLPSKDAVLEAAQLWIKKRQAG